MRKLASIQRIDDVNPIPGADAIEVVTVNAWKVVSKKGEFKPGDLAVYFEIDSFLPIKPEYEFLRKSSYKKMGDQEGFRLRTVKLRGQTSQGLVMPVDFEVKAGTAETDLLDDYELGDDVTSVLGIIKWEPPIPAELAGKIRGNFPSFVPKTDEERIQNLKSSYEELKLDTYYVTEKLDGSSATFYMNNGLFGVCSRNWDLEETEGNTFWKVARELQLEEKMRESEKNLVLQGELIGEGIQGNPYKLKRQTVRFFNAWDIDQQRYLSLDEFAEVMEWFDLEEVPLLVFEYKLPDDIDDLIKYADGKSALNVTSDREGIVIRSHDMKTSFKAISNLFLINEK